MKKSQNWFVFCIKIPLNFNKINHYFKIFSKCKALLFLLRTINIFDYFSIQNIKQQKWTRYYFSCFWSTFWVPEINNIILNSSINYFFSKAYKTNAAVTPFSCYSTTQGSGAKVGAASNIGILSTCKTACYV